MTDSKPTIAILGCGYVGLTTAVILANTGYKVYALEPLAPRLKSIQSGRSFFYEPGVDELLAKAVGGGSLNAIDSYQQAIKDSDIVFCCMGTPDNPDGSSNLSYVFAAAEQAARFMKPGAVFVQKSTVPVGTGQSIRDIFAKADLDVSYVSNPEFLRESTAIADTLWPDRVVVGGDDEPANQLVLDVYRDIERQADTTAKLAGISPPLSIPAVRYIGLGQNAAELVKVSSNAFLALKISFANSIAKLADKTGADVSQVMDAVGADRRIGHAFLKAGRGYGGGCFPKDVSGLIRSAQDYGVELGVMEAAAELNASMPHYIISKVLHELNVTEPLHSRQVAVLGLAFKPGTSDVRRSPAIELANSLAAHGAKVLAYDPEAMEEARPHLQDGVELSQSPSEAMADSSWVVIATDWPQFKELDLDQLATAKVEAVIDCMNCLEPATVSRAGLRYIGVGRSAER